MSTNLNGLVKKLRDIMRMDSGISGDAQRIEQIVWMLFLKIYDAKEQDWEMDDDDYVSIIPEKYRWHAWAPDDGKGTALTGEELLDFVNELFRTLKNISLPDHASLRQSIVKSMFEDTYQYMKNGVLLRQMVNVIDGIELDTMENFHALGDIYEMILKQLQAAGSAGEFYTPRAVTDFMAQKIEPHFGETMADFACGTGGFLVSWLKALDEQNQNDNSPAQQELRNRSIYGIEKKQFPYMLAITNLLLHDIDEPHIDHGNSLDKKVLDYTEKDQFDKILMNPPYGGNEAKSIQENFPKDLADSETADLFMSVIMYRLKQGGRAAVVLPDGFLFGTDNTKVNIKKKLLREFDLHTIIRLPGSVFAPYTSISTNILFFDRTHPTEKVWFYRLDMPEGYKHFSKTKPMLRSHFAPVDEWWDKRREIADEDTDSFKSKCYTAAEIAANHYNLDLCGIPHEEEDILPPQELIAQYEEKRSELNDKIDAILAQINSLLGGTKA